MRSGAIRRKRALSALITGVHIAEELAEPCSNSTGVPKPAASTALRRIGRAVLIQIQNRGSYSAATRVASSTFSTLAAQYLNSGIFPNGSSAGLVSRFAAAST